MIICIFNPEHDICLANGDKNFVPPSSALRFAKESCSLMSELYGKDAVCSSVEDFSWTQLKEHACTDDLIPWGWDARLLQTLLKKGVPSECLPSFPQINAIREIQHRSYVLQLQRQVECLSSAHKADILPVAVSDISAIDKVLSLCPKVVLKAPWSGSGRGLRWVTDKLTHHDCSWCEKVVKDQRTVIVEQRYDVAQDFALEYRICRGALKWEGFSLFQSKGGIYRSNHLLFDDEIYTKICSLSSQTHFDSIRSLIEHWIEENICSRYEGPLGVDLFVDQRGNIHLSEMNFRHTMGLVAHQYLINHPEAHAAQWIPQIPK